MPRRVYSNLVKYPKAERVSSYSRSRVEFTELDTSDMLKDFNLEARVEDRPHVYWRLLKTVTWLYLPGTVQDADRSTKTHPAPLGELLQMNPVASKKKLGLLSVDNTLGFFGHLCIELVRR